MNFGSEAEIKESSSSHCNNVFEKSQLSNMYFLCFYYNLLCKYVYNSAGASGFNVQTQLVLGASVWWEPSSVGTVI